MNFGLQNVEVNVQYVCFVSVPNTPLARLQVNKHDLFLMATGLTMGGKKCNLS